MEKKGKRRTNKQIKSSARPQAKAELKNVLLFGVMTKTSVSSDKTYLYKVGVKSAYIINGWSLSNKKIEKINWVYFMALESIS